MPIRSTPSRPGAAGPKPPLEAGGSGLQHLLQRARYLAGLDQVLRQCLPGTLAPHCRLANVRDGALVFLVESPVWKAKLRLHADDLIAAATAAGVPARALTMKVADPTPAPRPAAPHPPLSPAAREALRATAQTLDDPELRAILLKLASVP